MPMPNQIIAQLKDMGDKQIAEHALKFFKTGKGQYGEGDLFLGIRVPPLRQLAKEHQGIDLADAERVLQSPFHEARMLALFILARKFAAARNEQGRKDIYRMYLANTSGINNWDLVDCSAYKIVGPYLYEKNRAPLYRLARSRSLWERRIAIISTLHFIRQGDFSDTLAIAELLIRDQEDLIHKAAGWMLREVGNRNRRTEEQFLLKHYKSLPRTMLRYALEKFSPEERAAFLTGRR